MALSVGLSHQWPSQLALSKQGLSKASLAKLALAKQGWSIFA